jgi:pimeloyl-ACP methyl ester carboxylesterase
VRRTQVNPLHQPNSTPGAIFSGICLAYVRSARQLASQASAVVAAGLNIARWIVVVALVTLASKQAMCRRSEGDANVQDIVFGPVKQIEAGTLDVGYVEVGPSDGPPVVLLHGWPYDIQSYAEVAPALAARGYRVVVPFLRGFGTTRFLSQDTPRNAQQAVVAVDLINLMDALGIENAIVGGFDWGARTANIVGALWPERCRAMVSVSGYLIGSQAGNKTPLPPEAELAWWYQFYFATERGRAGYDKYRRDFAKLIWKLASPQWAFTDSIFDATASSFDNPDHVDIVIHDYRWRLGLAEGEDQYDELERKLADSPTIAVPTITLEGDANGAPHPQSSAYAAKFSGKYSNRTISGGVGHNLPQEAPQAFVDAIIEVDGFAS